MTTYEAKTDMTVERNKEKVDEAFRDFMETLSTHVQLVGGNVNEEFWENMPLEEVFKVLYPNGIILGFANKHVKHPFRISTNIRRSLEEE